MRGPYVELLVVLPVAHGNGVGRVLPEAVDPDFYPDIGADDDADESAPSAEISNMQDCKRCIEAAPDPRESCWGAIGNARCWVSGFWTSTGSGSRYKEAARRLWDTRQSLTSKELVQYWQRNVLGWWNYFRFGEAPTSVTRPPGWLD